MFQMWMMRNLQDPVTLVRALGLFAFLFSAGFWDLKRMSVPLPLLLAAGFLAGGLDLFGICSGKLQGAGPVWALLPGCFYLLLHFVSEGQIGTGDGLSILVLGLFAGLLNTVLITAAAQFLCALAAAGLLAVRKAGKKTRIPFLPFLGGAALVLYLLGGIG